eukprot:scaffold40537_cov36-Prasinocladus_malaysianus.AAC.1
MPGPKELVFASFAISSTKAHRKFTLRQPQTHIMQMHPQSLFCRRPMLADHFPKLHYHFDCCARGIFEAGAGLGRVSRAWRPLRGDTGAVALVSACLCPLLPRAWPGVWWPPLEETVCAA